jgi:hypothetical protein
MEWTLCEKEVFQCINMDEPGTEEGIRSIRDYIRGVSGHSFTEEEITHALDNLTSRQLVMVITSELKSSILNELRGVHGPLYEINDASHYSVTASGGNAWLESWRKKNPLARDRFEVAAIKHIQVFTPSETLADELLETGIFSGKKLKVSNVYLAVNNECVDGYLVDFLETPNADPDPITLSRDHDILFHQELRQIAETEPLSIDGLTPEEVWALTCVSGFASRSASYPVLDAAIQSLLEKGLVRDLQKVELREVKNRLRISQALPFKRVPSSPRSVLTDRGRDLMGRILNTLPVLAAHLMVMRVVGEYVHKYFSSLDEAIESHKKLKESGNPVTEVERIGAWCYYWWDVRPEGARFSYWEGERF